jgi:hypothetical protein
LYAFLTDDDHIVAFFMLVDLQWSSNHVATIVVFLPTLPSALLSCFADDEIVQVHLIYGL